MNVLLIPFTKVICPNYWLQKDSLHDNNEREWVSKLAILAQKWSKIPCGKKVIFGSLQTILLCSYQAVAVGIIDMKKCKMWHLTKDNCIFLFFPSLFSPSLLLSANVERFSVTLKGNFLCMSAWKGILITTINIFSKKKFLYSNWTL